MLIFKKRYFKENNFMLSFLEWFFLNILVRIDFIAKCQICREIYIKLPTNKKKVIFVKNKKPIFGDNEATLSQFKQTYYWQLTTQMQNFPY